tara:strand:+ start:982 stop:1785 length:804 start_codon:yes stop_codon:yes gene_type:complete
MKLAIITKAFSDALKNMMIKGKQLTSGGFSSGNLGTEVHLTLTGNELMFYNGDGTFMARLKLDNPIVRGTEDGVCSIDSSDLISYLSTFDKDEYVFISVSDGCMSITQAVTEDDTTVKKAVCPILNEHSDLETINRMITMVSHINYEAIPNNLPNFSNSKFEGAFTLSNDEFKKALNNCELVKTGLFKLDFNARTVTFSSEMNRQNRYSERVIPTFTLGEEATVMFSSPLYSFFDSSQTLNFYVKDEFPVLIVAEDRLLLKAPYVGE